MTYTTARQRVEGDIRRDHPDWTDAQVLARVAAVLDEIEDEESAADIMDRYDHDEE